MTALATVSHRMWLWQGWLPASYEESSLFPGLTILGLALYAVVTGAAPRGAYPGPNIWLRRLTAAAAVIIAVVLARIWTGPSAWQLGPIALPPFRPYRVFTLAVVFLIGALLVSERFRGTWKQRDAVTFYAAAAVVFWLLTLGPEPTWAGERIVTYGPYRLFFEVPVPHVVRVSARAWIAVLPCLAVLAALGPGL